GWHAAARGCTGLVRAQRWRARGRGRLLPARRRASAALGTPPPHAPAAGAALAPATNRRQPRIRARHDGPGRLLRGAGPAVTEDTTGPASAPGPCVNCVCALAARLSPRRRLRAP